VCEYTSKLGVVNPVSGCILREWEVTYGISVGFVIELEEDTEAGVCKDGMGGFGENVIV